MLNADPDSRGLASIPRQESSVIACPYQTTQPEHRAWRALPGRTRSSSTTLPRSRQNTKTTTSPPSPAPQRAPCNSFSLLAFEGPFALVCRWVNEALAPTSPAVCAWCQRLSRAFGTLPGVGQLRIPTVPRHLEGYVHLPSDVLRPSVSFGCAQRY